MQKSVFECDLTQRQIEALERTIRGIMKAGEDNIRYYKLCRGCAGEVEVFGGRPLLEVKGHYVL